MDHPVYLGCAYQLTVQIGENRHEDAGKLQKVFLTSNSQRHEVKIEGGLRTSTKSTVELGPEANITVFSKVLSGQLNQI